MLPPSLGRLSSLEVLELEGNPFDDPVLLEKMKDGAEVTMRYLSIRALASPFEIDPPPPLLPRVFVAEQKFQTRRVSRNERRGTLFARQRKYDAAGLDEPDSDSDIPFPSTLGSPLSITIPTTSSNNEEDDSPKDYDTAGNPLNFGPEALAVPSLTFFPR